jgi:hypothetical protein
MARYTSKNTSLGMALHVENTSLGMPMRDSAASVTV